MPTEQIIIVTSCGTVWLNKMIDLLPLKWSINFDITQFTCFGVVPLQPSRRRCPKGYAQGSGVSSREQWGQSWSWRSWRSSRSQAAAGSEPDMKYSSGAQQASDPRSLDPLWEQLMATSPEYGWDDVKWCVVTQHLAVFWNSLFVQPNNKCVSASEPHIPGRTQKDWFDCELVFFHSSTLWHLSWIYGLIRCSSTAV